jgi:hypothetical protein
LFITRGGQHPLYGKINNPKLDRGDFIFVPPEAPEKTIAAKKASEAGMPQATPRTSESGPAEVRGDRVASTPKAANTPHHVLKPGRGPFVLDDFVPSTWTQNNVSHYPPKPDLAKILQILFLVSSFEGDGGHPGSNTIWIDEIVLR